MFISRLAKSVAVFGFLCSIALPGLAADKTNGGEQIKIGFITSLSGIGAVPGQEMLNGFKTALDEIGNKMGGREVKVFVEDDESSPIKAAQKVQKLIKTDKVDVIAGFYFSPVAYAAAPVADALQVPCVIAEAGADNLTQRNTKHWVIRTAFTGSQPTHPFGEYAAKQLKYKRIVTIASDYPYGYEAVGGFQKSFEANGGRIVQKVWVSLDSKDYSALIKQITKDADAVFICVSGKSVELLPHQYNEFGPKLPVLGSLTTFDESALAKFGNELNKGISANVYSATLDNPANKKFVASYRAKIGTNPGWFSESGYTSVLWIKSAADTLKGDVSDKQKFMTALRKVVLLNAPRGPISLDEYGNPIENVYIRKVENVNGAYRNTVIFTYQKVSQFWKSKPEAYLAEPPYTKDYPPCNFCTATR